MEKAIIKELKKGTYFKFKDSETAPVWVRGEYIREAKKYSCYKFDDVNHEKLTKGSQEVFINFVF